MFYCDQNDSLTNEVLIPYNYSYFFSQEMMMPQRMMSQKSKNSTLCSVILWGVVGSQVKVVQGVESVMGMLDFTHNTILQTAPLLPWIPIRTLFSKPNWTQQRCLQLLRQYSGEVGLLKILCGTQVLHLWEFPIKMAPR